MFHFLGSTPPRHRTIQKLTPRILTCKDDNDNLKCARGVQKVAQSSEGHPRQHQADQEVDAGTSVHMCDVRLRPRLSSCCSCREKRAAACFYREQKGFHDGAWNCACSAVLFCSWNLSEATHRTSQGQPRHIQRADTPSWRLLKSHFQFCFSSPHRAWGSLPLCREPSTDCFLNGEQCFFFFYVRLSHYFSPQVYCLFYFCEFRIGLLNINVVLDWKINILALKFV